MTSLGRKCLGAQILLSLPLLVHAGLLADLVYTITSFSSLSDTTATCIMHNDVAFVGTAYDTSPSDTAAGCSSYCDELSESENCQFWAWVEETKACTVYTAFQKAVASEGVVSGWSCSLAGIMKNVGCFDLSSLGATTELPDATYAELFWSSIRGSYWDGAGNTYLAMSADPSSASGSAFMTLDPFVEDPIDADICSVTCKDNTDQVCGDTTKSAWSLYTKPAGAKWLRGCYTETELEGVIKEKRVIAEANWSDIYAGVLEADRPLVGVQRNESDSTAIIYFLNEISDAADTSANACGIVCTDADVIAPNCGSIANNQIAVYTVPQVVWVATTAVTTATATSTVASVTWNRISFKSSDGETDCLMFDDTKFHGSSDLGSLTLTSAEDCSYSCDADSECEFWTWSGGSTCTLFATFIGRYQAADTMAGWRCNQTGSLVSLGCMGTSSFMNDPLMTVVTDLSYSDLFWASVSASYWGSPTYMALAANAEGEGSAASYTFDELTDNYLADTECGTACPDSPDKVCGNYVTDSTSSSAWTVYKLPEAPLAHEHGCYLRSEIINYIISTETISDAKFRDIWAGTLKRDYPLVGVEMYSESAAYVHFMDSIPSGLESQSAECGIQCTDTDETRPYCGSLSDTYVAVFVVPQVVASPQTTTANSAVASSASSTCMMHYETQFVGSTDVVKLAATGPAECSAACDELGFLDDEAGECHFWAWSSSDQSCTLSNSYTAAVARADYVSGWLCARVGIIAPVGCLGTTSLGTFESMPSLNSQDVFWDAVNASFWGAQDKKFMALASDGAGGVAARFVTDELDASTPLPETECSNPCPGFLEQSCGNYVEQTIAESAWSVYTLGGLRATYWYRGCYSSSQLDRYVVESTTVDYAVFSTIWTEALRRQHAIVGVRYAADAISADVYFMDRLADLTTTTGYQFCGDECKDVTDVKSRCGRFSDDYVAVYVIPQVVHFTTTVTSTKTTSTVTTTSTTSTTSSTSTTTMTSTATSTSSTSSTSTSTTATTTTSSTTISSTQTSSTSTTTTMTTTSSTTISSTQTSSTSTTATMTSSTTISSTQTSSTSTSTTTTVTSSTSSTLTHTSTVSSSATQTSSTSTSTTMSMTSTTSSTLTQTSIVTSTATQTSSTTTSTTMTVTSTSSNTLTQTSTTTSTATRTSTVTSTATQTSTTTGTATRTSTIASTATRTSATDMTTQSTTATATTTAGTTFASSTTTTTSSEGELITTSPAADDQTTTGSETNDNTSIVTTAGSSYQGTTTKKDPSTRSSEDAIKCSDDASFEDAYGLSCSDWDGENCSKTDDMYTEALLNEVLAACPIACGLCESSSSTEEEETTQPAGSLVTAYKVSMTVAVAADFGDLEESVIKEGLIEAFYQVIKDSGVSKDNIAVEFVDAETGEPVRRLGSGVSAKYSIATSTSSTLLTIVKQATTLTSDTSSQSTFAAAITTSTGIDASSVSTSVTSTASVSKEEMFLVGDTLSSTTATSSSSTSTNTTGSTSSSSSSASTVVLADGCVDYDFVDEQGESCTSWLGYDCSNQNWLSSERPYTTAGLAEVRENCLLSCNLCTTSDRATTSELLESCQDDVFSEDLCKLWRGLNCSAAADYGFSDRYVETLKARCPASCGHCEATDASAVACEDNADFTDAQGDSCEGWAGYDCAVSYSAYTWHDMREVQANCRDSCGYCSDSYQVSRATVLSATDDCADDASFTIAGQFGCDFFVGKSCTYSDLYLDLRWLYGPADIVEWHEDLWAHCPVSCGICKPEGFQTDADLLLECQDDSSLEAWCESNWDGVDCGDWSSQVSLGENTEATAYNATVFGRCPKSCGLCTPPTCPAGTFRNTETHTCEACPEGTYASSARSGEEALTCTKARPGFSVPTTGATEEVTCDFGTFSDSYGQPECTDCAPGYFAKLRGSSECEACSAGFFASTNGSSACDRCPFGSWEDSAASSGCEACPSTFSTLELGATSSSSCVCPVGAYFDKDTAECHACPRGFSCLGGAKSVSDETGVDPTVFLLPGMMSTSDEPLSAYSCINEEDGCPGLRAPVGKSGNMSAVCAQGSFGVRCGSCQDGFYFDDDEGCLECMNSWEADDVLRLVLIAVAISFSMYRSYEEQAADDFPPEVMFWLGVNFLVFLQAMEGLPLVWPGPIQALFDIVNYINAFGVFDNILTVQEDCLFGSSASARLTRDLVKPFLPVVLFLPVALVHRLWRKSHVNPFVVISTMAALFSTVFVQVSVMVFNTFPTEQMPNGKLFVTYHPRVEQGTSEWWALVPLSIVAILVYGVGFLAFVGYGLYRMPRMAALKEDAIDMYSFFGDHRPSVYWWGGVLILYSFFFAMCNAIIENPYVRVYLTMACTVIYTLLEVAFLPGITRETQWVEVIAQLGMMLFLAQSTGCLFDEDVDMTEHLMPVKWMIFWLVVTCLCIVLLRIGIALRPANFSEERLLAQKTRILAESRIWMNEATVMGLREYLEAAPELSYFDCQVIRDWTLASRTGFLRAAPRLTHNVGKDFAAHVYSGHRLSYAPPGMSSTTSNYDRARASMAVVDKWVREGRPDSGLGMASAFSMGFAMSTAASTAHPKSSISSMLDQFSKSSTRSGIDSSRRGSQEDHCPKSCMDGSRRGSQDGAQVHFEVDVDDARGQDGQAEGFIGQGLVIPALTVPERLGRQGAIAYAEQCLRIVV